MTSRKKMMVVSFTAVMAALAGAWCHAQAILIRRNQLADLRHEAQCIRTKPACDLLLQELKTLKKQTATFAASTIGESAVPLEKLFADLNNMEVTNRSLTSATSSTNGPFRQTPLSLSFTGSFSTVFELLKRIGDDDRSIVRVRRLQIGHDPTAAPDALTVLLQVDSFAFVDGDMR